MRTDNPVNRLTCVFSVLIVVSLVTTILVPLSFSSVGHAAAETNQTIIVQGENAYNRNQTEDSLQRKYEPNNPSSTAVTEKAGPTEIEPQLGKLSENIQSEKNLSSHKEGWWDNFTYIEDPAKLVIGVNADYAKVIDLIVENGGKLVNTISMKGEVAALVADIPLNALPSFLTQVRASNLVRYIEPDMKVHIQLVPNDPYWSSQWGPQKIEADLAWDTTVGSPDVLVAIVDTGIDYNHSDLAANYVSLGHDWVNMDNDPMDDHGHGTHCAGITAAVLNNDIGIAGLAQVRVMAEKVLTSGGWGYWDWIANGIVHAADQGADIISMSLGGYEYSELLHEAVKYAYDSGVLLVAAAGNEATSIKLYPAGFDEVIAVAATDNNDYTAWWSNWGDWIELAAPGVDIYSTVPWGYESWSGTSMATPHVSGVAALVRSLYPDKSRDWVRLWLRYTADDLGDPGFDVYYGYGRINARKAVEEAPPAHDLIAYEWVTPLYVEPGASEIINATILNFGENDENDIVVQLLVDNTIVDSTLISFLASGDSTTVDLLWNPTVEGLHTVTLYVVPVPGETNIANNVLSKYIYVGFPVKAVVLHSAGNISGDITANWQVLNSEWYRFGDNMIYIDYTTLNIEGITYENIVATEADVLIISCAYSSGMGWEFTDSEIEAIERYVYEGHGLIATAGTFYYSVPNNNKLAPLFGLNETTTWNSTGTDLLHLQDNTHPLFRNVPNPFVFAYVGTALPSDGKWDLNELAGGEYLALGHYRESAIVTFRGLVYIAPWLEVIPSYYQHHLQLLYNAIIWSRYQRPEHELVVSLEAPARLKPGESTLLNATVSNKGKNDESNVELQILIDNMIVDNVTISELPVDSSYTLSYLWTPTVQKMYNVTAYAPPIAGEEFTNNNVATKMVLVLFIRVEKVLVYTDDAYVMPSSRYPIVALNNLGINYTHYSDDPSGFGVALTSQPWDLVIVDHCNYYAIGTYWTELDEYVRNGGLLVLSTFDIDGSNSEPTTLWDTMGVSWVSDMWSPEPVYRWMPSHPIFTFPYTVGDLTSYIEGYGDDGDHVAATTGTPIAGFTISPEEDYAGIVVGNTYQTVLFSFTLDEFRYDQDGDGKLDAIELWGNAIAYLARGYEHDLAVTLEAPTCLELGTSVLLEATVYNKGLENENNVELQLLIDNAIVDSVIIPELPVDSSYTLSHLWTPTVEGTYEVKAYAPSVPGEEYTINNVVTKNVKVRPIKGYILFDQTHGTDWIANYSIWVENLTERGYIIETHISGPITPIVLEGYDVLVIPQAYVNYTSDELSAIENFVMDGGGLLVIGDDNPWIYTNLTSFAGITWASGGYPGYTSNITPHPVTEGVAVADFVAPVSQLYVASPAEDLIRDNYGYQILLAVSEVGPGKVIGIADEDTIRDWGIGYTNNLRLANNMIDWLATRYEHDLSVSLVVPIYLKPDNSTLLEATVYNKGLENENTVELQLLIDNTIVDSVIIPELPVDSSYTLSHLWTPTVEGTYEVKAYAPPVPGEEYILNNVKTAKVFVSALVIALCMNVDPWGYTSNEDILNFYGIPYVILHSSDFGGVDLSGFTKVVIASDQDQAFYNAMDAYRWWFEDYARSGGILEIHAADWGSHGSGWVGSLPGGLGWASYYANYVTIVDGTHPVVTTPNPISDAELDGWNYSVHGYFHTYPADPHIVIIEDSTGQPAYLEFDYGAGFIVASSQTLEHAYRWRYSQILVNSLLYIPVKYDHDLAVSLEAPTSLKLGTSALLNATVRNRGLNDENNVELQLLIDNAIVDSVIIPELPVDSSYTLSYLWTPTVEGTYEVKAYAPPVPGEEYIQNNISTRIITVRSIDEAIDEGVAWLAAQQNPDGSWGSSYPVGQTGLAVLKLAEHAVDGKYGYGLPSPFDPAYPYREHVEKGLNYIFAKASVIDISVQPAGNPDTNGNGKGVYFSSWGYERTCETSIAMMAIAASRAPGRVVNVPGSAVDGWRYKDVLQDAVDYMAWGQTDRGYGEGGWYYEEMDNSGDWSDQSNTGWATLGLGFAESPAYGFMCTIPAFVKTEMNIWIDYIQNDVDGDPNDGGAGYTDPNGWVNILKTGDLLYMMKFVDDNAATPRVQDAVAYLVRHWNDANVDPGWRGAPGEVAGYHAMYNVMNGLTTLGIHVIDGIDWQSEFENVLVAQQLDDGSWPVTYWDVGDRILSTEWALLTLQKVAPPPIVRKEWDAFITATFPGGSDDAIFGVRPDASSGFDSECDIPEPPPPPEPPYVRAYFYYPEQTPDELHRSCLALENIMEWPLRIEYADNIENVTLTWNVENIPSEYSVLLYRGGDLVADMRAEDNYTFEASAGSYDFKIVVGTIVPFTLELTLGWNMISFPILLENMSPDSIFSGYYVLYRWDAENKRYVLHADSGSLIEPDPNVEVGVGYWVYVLEDENVDLPGFPVNQLTLSLCQGWNLIGPPYGGSSIADPADDPDNSILPWAFTWNAVEKSYDTTQLLEAGKGYWMYALQGCGLTLIGGK